MGLRGVRYWTLAIALGVYPGAVFRYMSPTVDREVTQMADWAKKNRKPGDANTAAVQDHVPQLVDAAESR